MSDQTVFRDKKVLFIIWVCVGFKIRTILGEGNHGRRRKGMVVHDPVVDVSKGNSVSIATREQKAKG